MAEVRISVSAEGRLRIDGPLTFETVDAKLVERSRGSLEGRSDLVVDLGGVDEGDSAGLALLIEWRCWAGRAGTTLTFQNVPASLLAIAQISEVGGLLGLAHR